MSLGKMIRTTLWGFLGFIGLCYTLTKVFKETKLFSLNIPDWVFFLWLSLATLLLSVIVYYLIKNKEMGDDSLGKGFEDLKKELADYKAGVSEAVAGIDQKLRDQQEIVAKIYNKQVHNKSRSDIALEPTDDILTVLGLPAVNASKCATMSSIEVIFEQTYEGKGQGDLNILINKLEERGLIAVSWNYEGEHMVEITSKGLKYYDEHRNKAA